MKKTQMRPSTCFPINLWTRNNPVKSTNLLNAIVFPMRKFNSTNEFKFAELRELVRQTPAWKQSSESDRVWSLKFLNRNSESKLTALVRLNNRRSGGEIYSKREFLRSFAKMEPSDNDGEPTSINLKVPGEVNSSQSVEVVVLGEDNAAIRPNSGYDARSGSVDDANACEPSHSSEMEGYEETSIGVGKVVNLTDLTLREVPNVTEIENKVEDETTVSELGESRLFDNSTNELSIHVESYVEQAPSVRETNKGSTFAETETNETKQPYGDVPVHAPEIESTIPDDINDTENEFEDLGKLFSANSPVISSSVQKSDRHVRDEKSGAKNSNKKERKRKSVSACVPRPNYFLGIPVSSPRIHRQVLTVQEHMVSSEAAMFPYLIDVATLHLTLFVFHLQEEQLGVAKDCMTNLEEKLASSKPSIILNFRNLGDFKNRVMFVSIAEDESYQELVTLRSTALRVFNEAGFQVQEEGGDWHPHLTVAKISYIRKTSSGTKAPRKIPASLYAKYKEDKFGLQHVTAVQLLSMNRPKDSRRYYQCESSVQLRPEGEKDDHSACCFPRRPARPQDRGANALVPSAEEGAVNKSSDNTQVANPELTDSDSIVAYTESLATDLEEQQKPSGSTNK